MAKAVGSSPTESTIIADKSEQERGVWVWFLYILKCNDGSFYTGITNDLQKRLKDHNSAKASKYTRARLPVVFVYTEELESKSQALKREAEIKRLNRIQKEQLVGKNNDQYRIH